MPKKVSPIISDQAIEFYKSQWDNLNAGVTFTLEAFRDLYRRTLHEMKGKFLEGELMLMIDVFNGTWLTPGIAGQHIIAEVSDGCDLDGLDKKWEINKKILIEKLESLPIFSLACLEIWATGFWRSKNSEGEVGTYSTQDFKKWMEVLV